jgi:transcriptional regulator with XRE-family HTH domain
MPTGEATVCMKAGAALRAFLVPSVRPTDVAREAGVTPQYVYAVLNGKRPASKRLIEAAGRLGLPIDVIFGSEMREPADGEFANLIAEALIVFHSRHVAERGPTAEPTEQDGA